MRHMVEESKEFKRKRGPRKVPVQGWGAHGGAHLGWVEPEADVCPGEEVGGERGLGQVRPRLVVQAYYRDKRRSVIMNGGHFDFVCSSARTMHPHVGPQHV